MTGVTSVAVADAVAPIDLPERIVAIDVLRGVALLGILVMNIQAFSMPDAAYLNPSAYGMGKVPAPGTAGQRGYRVYGYVDARLEAAERARGAAIMAEIVMAGGRQAWIAQLRKREWERQFAVDEARRREAEARRQEMLRTLAKEYAAGRAVYQVCALFGPYLVGEARAHLARLSADYL